MKLTKTQQKELTNHSAKLNEALESLDEACNEYNRTDDKDVAKPVLEAAVDAYSLVVGGAKAFCQNIAGQIDNFIGDKSDTWQESDKGEAHSGWKEQWEEFDPDSITINDLMDSDGIASISDIDNPAEALDELPTEPEV